MTKNILTWDLGATKCNAGLITYHTQTQDLVCDKNFSVKLAETSSLNDLINQLEKGLDFCMFDADAICIGGAGHFDGETLLLENVYPYSMTFAQMAKQYAWPTYSVIHDYASIVCATFTSYMQSENNVRRLNDCPVNPHGRRVALGIGTGLGLKDGVLLPNGDFWLGQNEIGHIGITQPPTAPHHIMQRHKELMHFLQTQTAMQTHQPITFEYLLSGKGTVRLYQFFYADNPHISPELVGEKMRAGTAPELVETFAWYLGLFVGTTQLIFMPEGGIWITGGVAVNHLEVFEHKAFFDGIYATPAYRAQREQYPLGILCNLEHALIGSGYYAAKRLLD